MLADLLQFVGNSFAALWLVERLQMSVKAHKPVRIATIYVVPGVGLHSVFGLGPKWAQTVHPGEADRKMVQNALELQQ